MMFYILTYTFLLWTIDKIKEVKIKMENNKLVIKRVAAIN